MNYEQEIGVVLQDELKRIYTGEIQDLYPYLLSRFIVENHKDKTAFNPLLKKHFMDYLLGLLGVKSLYYKKEILFLGYHEENSLSNILDKWWVSIGMDEESIFKEVWGEVKKARRKSRLTNFKFRKDTYYDEILKLGALKELESFYEIESNVGPQKLEGFDYPIHFKGNHTKVLDEYLERIKNSPYNNEGYTEYDVRKYLFYHMDELENGLQVRGKNQNLKSSHVDFIARDKNGTLTLINIMLKKSKDSIYNIDFYRKEAAKLYDEEDVRVILLFAYRDTFVEQYVENIEVFHYIPKVRFGKIRTIKFSKINKENKKC